MRYKLTDNFWRHEFRCPCLECAHKTPVVDIELVQAMQNSVNYFSALRGNSLVAVVTSGNRCAKHNESIGGRPNSQHIDGIAADYFIQGISITQLGDYLETLAERDGVDKWGIGKYTTHVHLDIRRDKRSRWTR